MKTTSSNLLLDLSCYERSPEDYSYVETNRNDYAAIYIAGWCRDNDGSGTLAGYGVFYPRGQFQSAQVTIKTPNALVEYARLAAVLHALVDIANSLHENPIKCRYEIIMDSKVDIYPVLSSSNQWSDMNWKSADGLPFAHVALIRRAFSALNYINQCYYKANLSRLKFSCVKENFGLAIAQSLAIAATYP